ncbi:ATP-binding protein [Kiloniella laminariae]|uniref:histidine kinase n=1 Tax=Kiloniella laminariae TaxID=454162 RepID=A0ABT4LJZ4_9PROT|nr:CHASE4 domain-containing protein [Kiloniella laminariae]MCZ4281420.1 ATP-binding protein [Kiloniella laminariae]
MKGKIKLKDVQLVTTTIENSAVTTHYDAQSPGEESGSKMTIQSKIGSLLAVLFLALILFSAGILYKVIIPQFKNLDHDNAIQSARQILNTLNDELAHLVVYSSDWGIWDDTYNYMDSRDVNFINSSAPDETLVFTDIDLLGFINMDGELVWGRWRNIEEEGYSDLDLKYSTHQTIRHFSPENVIANESISGYIQTRQGPMLLAAYPILKSNGDGPPNGIAIIGRFLDQKRLDKIAADLNVVFHKISTDPEALPPKHPIPEDLFTETIDPGNVALYSPADEEVFYSFFDIRDVTSVSLMRLVHPHPMDILAKGQFAISSALQLIAAFFAITLFFVVITLRRIVVLPLATLRDKITSLGHGREHSDGTSKPSHSNELQLALQSFDAMEEEIREHQNELENKVRDRTRWLQETNGQLEREIRERQKTEQRLLAAKLDAEKANQSKSEFLATVSHEIRTPMNGVVGMTSLLMESNLDQEQKEYLQSISKSADHLLVLINDILDISKLETGTSELQHHDFNIAELLNSVITAKSPHATAKGLKLVNELDPALPLWLQGDPTRLKQMLYNLLANAIKFTNKGQIKVTISAALPLEGTTQMVYCCVKDSGIGIAAEDQRRIFERFTQVDGSASRKHGGVGLGLSIVKHLCDQMGGEVGLESTPDEGSLFWFKIPLEIGKAPGGEAEVSSEPTPVFVEETVDDSTTPISPPLQSENISADSLHILIAEDNQINQMLLTKFLSKKGHRIDVVINGKEAFQFVKQQTPDVILMDIQMPDMDGIQATQKIRTLEGEKGRVPIIAVTANAMQGDRDSYLAAGMDDYLSKPVDFKRLIELIHHYTHLSQK